MVANTPLGLPYQTGTDRPCDAPTTWCSFADDLETLMIAINNKTGRLSPAVPCARVERFSPMVVDMTVNLFGLPIAWESVEYDTDSMVDLTRSLYEVKPRRAGTYLVFTSMAATGISTSGGARKLGAYVNNSFFVDPIFNNTAGTDTHEDLVPALETTPLQYWRLAFAHIFDPVTFTFGYSSVAAGSGNDVLVVVGAMMSVYWISDVT